MTIIERIQNLAKKITGKDISGETIQQALENFEKAVNETPRQKQSQDYSKRRGYTASKSVDDE